MQKNSSRAETTCLLLYSGGLDSLIAAKILERQGIIVKAIRFISPFFGYELKNNEEKARHEALKKYGIDLVIMDITRDYIGLLTTPRYGYGKHFNPCIDCRIFMIKETLKRLDEFGATFIATGEVVGQRPFSQRRDAMNLIEKDAGACGRILRPLCALNLPATPMEKSGIVDRSRLLGISGRGRKTQIALAKELGINDYPQPGGGCILTDPVISQEIRKFIRMRKGFQPEDILLAMIGRRFMLNDGSWLVLGRNKRENMRLLSLFRHGDICLRTAEGTGPLGLWRRPAMQTGMANVDERWYERCEAKASDILLRYVKHGKGVLQIHVSEDPSFDRNTLILQNIYK
ncbi:MAG: thiamine biosynthesis protein [Dissulfurimicrobium sp.]|uniref:thiamine biosynthesis protein n=1 Tax=Dissulfurimicrobium sp. TaxID=2022436 RepID=UPI00404AA68C